MKKLFFVATALLCGAISANAVDYLVQTGKAGDAVWTDAAINKIKETSPNVKVISFDTTGVAKLPTTGEIWFAAGTYDFTASYDMTANTKLIGGFAGTETYASAPKKQNNKPYDYVNPTILNVVQPTGDNATPIRLFKTDAQSGVVLTGLTIQNSKHTAGGGVYKVHATNNIKYCTFKNNSTTADGGAILVYNSNATIEGCLFEGNKAANGGAIRIGGETTNLTATIKDCDFKNNEATNASNGGGAISKVQAIALNATGCTFDGNKAINGGALLINTTKDAIVANSTFANNVATTNGGALYLVGSDTITIDGCKMFLNTAVQGSAIYDNASQVSIITNNVIYNNGAVVDAVNNKYPAVTYIKPLLFANNTICFNLGRVNVISNVANTEVANNIVWGNKVHASSSTAEKPAFTSASFNFANATGEAGCTVSNNYTQNDITSSSTGNKIVISNNVKIADSKTDFEAVPDTFGVVPAERTAKYEKVLNANFALVSGSQFIDKGTDLTCVTTDILGTAREAGKYDVGAYEFVGGGVGSAFENTEKAPLDIQAALQAGEVYNLLGQRVGELQTGNIYIVGGQKILMR